jgi:hypothetical protein
VQWTKPLRISTLVALKVERRQVDREIAALDVLIDSIPS